MPSKATALARRLRRAQTDEEKQLWRKLKAGRFAGFKFRRQHPVQDYILDFYCPLARLSVELDGFQHGMPDSIRRDDKRSEFLAGQQILELRFWNHQWRQNPDGVLLDIWMTLQERTGCLQVERKEENQRFIPPNPAQLTAKPAKPPTCYPVPPLPVPLPQASLGERGSEK